MLEPSKADGLQPSLIRVEITENAVYGRGHHSVIKLLNQIVQIGYRLALDDFGTGSGSLQLLASLPISEIKIDKSFVSGMSTDLKKSAIVGGLIATGLAMRIDVVAEGVETEEEANQLRALGARFAQGYLWSKPLPMSQFVGFNQLFGSTAVRQREENGNQSLNSPIGAARRR